MGDDRDAANPQAKIREFVSRQLVGAEDGEELDDGVDLLANGLIDSVGVFQLVTFIERELETDIPDQDLTMKNFRSLKDIATYLESRKESRRTES